MLTAKLAGDPLLSNLVDKSAYDRFIEIEQQMQAVKSKGDTKEYNRLQKQLTEAFTDMVTLGLSESSRDSLSKSMEHD